jgi:23S rRNA (cytidine1920-2'-O)/16S rRNA (cytidine1409-2'-O)-methyltransferase
VLLVKPQFERGRGGVGKDGVVKSASEAQAAVDDITSWISKRGWQVEGSIPSPILGGDGNREFLLGARPD